MKTFLTFALLGLFTPLSLFSTEKTRLEEVATFPDQQLTGIAISKSGRTFINFPFWSDSHTTSVAEVLPDGSLKPYPDAAWNAKEGDAGKRWICVQSVYVDDTDHLWILDAASPKMEAVVPGGAKLIKINLLTNKIVQAIPFDESLAPEKSYLNDVRVEVGTNHAYITESGLGSILVVNLTTGKARKVMAEDRSVKAEEDVTLEVDGIKPIDPKTGKTPKMQADGIALDETAGELYFHALTGYTLYKIKTSGNESLSEKDLVAKIENLGKTPATDGMLMGKEQTVYLTTFENNSISRWNGTSGKLETVIKDDRLQ